jgi:hypothetical protein
MKELVLLVLFVGIALAAWLVVRAYLTFRDLSQKWELRTAEAQDSTEFWLVKGEHADFVGRALRAAPDYFLQCSEMEAKGEEMLMERNVALSVIRRKR